MDELPLYFNDQDAIVTAARDGNYQITELLIGQSTDIENRDERGNTPLIAAAEEGHVAIVELLLEHGANVNATNEDGDTAIDFAKFREYGEIVEILRNHGAKEKEGLSAVEERWNQMYDAFAQTDAVKRLVSKIKKET